MLHAEYLDATSEYVFVNPSGIDTAACMNRVSTQSERERYQMHSIHTCHFTDKTFTK
jgi:hypothetical protein